LKPTTPQSDAGTRIEPIESPPKAAGTIRAATDALDPLDEPPDMVTIVRVLNLSVVAVVADQAVRHFDEVVLAEDNATSVFD
jgi:hypothetical protein